MNPTQHSDEQLEDILQSLPLRRPSEMLDHRVTHALSGRAAVWRRLAAAACFGALCFWVGMFVGNGGAATPVDQPAAQEAVTPRPAPASATGSVLAANTTRIDTQWPVAQAQLVYSIDAGPPVRATIRDAIEQTRWVDPQTKQDIELTRPVREISFTRDTPY